VLNSLQNIAIMKKSILVGIALFLNISLFAQKTWFSVYTDSIQFVKDAKTLTERFQNDIYTLVGNEKFVITPILNTTPYLIYYDSRFKSANLPLWDQVIPQQKEFFYEVAGSEREGKIAFGLFFNGFYLPHELGHALQDFANNNITDVSYANEYFANTVAILWWRKQNRTEELKACYEYAKKMWSKLPNPVPKNESEEEYFTKNYEKASQNPYTYGYMQFKQFIQIYEDKSLPNFETFLKTFLIKK